MATEIGTLVAKFTADISNFEAGRKRVESGLKQTTSHAQQFSNALRNSINSVSPQMGQLATSFESITAGAGGMVGAVGAAGIAIAAFAVIAGGAAKVIYDLATGAASISDKIGDMADKINFSVRTLSGLQTAAEASGGSLEGLVTALGIFDKNIEAAAQGDERLSKLFKGLNIDAKDNEKAFRQVADILVKLGGTSQQTALAMELFGRSGKDVLGIIKAADGNVEEFIKRMEALGIVIGDDAVKAADEFDKKMVTVKAQLAAVTRQLGEEFIPVVQQGATNISNWLAKNQGEIRKTITEFHNLLKTIATLVNYIMAINPIVVTVQIVRMFSNLLPTSASGQAITNQQQRNVFTQDPVTGRRIYSGNAPYDTAGEFAIAGGAGQFSTGAGGGAATPQANALADQVRKLLGRGGGGGGGGEKTDALAEMKKLADVQLRIFEEGLKREEDDIDRSYDKRRITVEVYQRAITRLEERRHKAVVDTLNDEEKAINSSKTLKASEKKIQLQELLLKRQQEANRHRREENDLEDKILHTTRERLVTMERLTALETRPRRSLPDIGGITRPRRAENEDIGGLTRPRIATGAEQAAREQYQRHLDKMRQLASDLTSILDRAIYDGFQGGLKRGFQSLTLGILDLLQNVFMRKLEDILTNALSGIGQGQGGKKGGILNNLPSIILSGVAGIFGGGASAGGLGSAFAGAFASGGTIPMGQYGVVHDNEKVVATPYGALVIPGQTTNNNSGGNTYIINNHFDERATAQSYKSPKSRRELAASVAAAIRQHID